MPRADNTQGEVQGVADIYAGETDFNQISFMIRSMLQKEVNVAIPVKVTKVMAGSGSVGYVQALPLVNDMDAQGNAVDVAVIPSLPYFDYKAVKLPLLQTPLWEILVLRYLHRKIPVM